VTDWLPELDVLRSIDTRLSFVVTRLDQIGHDTLYGSREDMVQSGVLREIATAVKQRQPVSVSITVSGAGNPQDVANRIASTLRTQLAY